MKISAMVGNRGGTMEIRESVRVAFKEFIFPEIEKIEKSTREIGLRLDATNKRLDDIAVHLVDQSRRIDAVREELGGRIDQTNVRIDAFSDNFLKRLDALSAAFQMRLDRLYEIIVRRDDHSNLEERVKLLEQDISELKRRVAA